MSSDGTKLVAVAQNDNIWISNDSGATWTENTSIGSTKILGSLLLRQQMEPSWRRL